MGATVSPTIPLGFGDLPSQGVRGFVMHLSKKAFAVICSEGMMLLSNFNRGSLVLVAEEPSLLFHPVASLPKAGKLEKHMG